MFNTIHLQNENRNHGRFVPDLMSEHDCKE